MKSDTQAAAARTSPACAGSALTEGMRRKPASSSNQSLPSLRRESSGPAARDLASRGAMRDAAVLRLGEQPQLLERVVLDLADALAGDVERPAHLVERLWACRR